MLLTETLPAQAREVLAASPTLLAYRVDRPALVGTWQNFEADALRRGGCPRFGARPAPLAHVGVARSIAARRRASAPSHSSWAMEGIVFAGSRKAARHAEYRSRCTGPMPQAQWCQRCESGFLAIGVAAVAVLRQFGGARGELVQGAASVCNCASQVVYQHPRGTKSGPRSCTKRFCQPWYESFSVRISLPTATIWLTSRPCRLLRWGEQALAFVVGKPSPGCLVTTAVLPD